MRPTPPRPKPSSHHPKPRRPESPTVAATATHIENFCEKFLKNPRRALEIYEELPLQETFLQNLEQSFAGTLHLEQSFGEDRPHGQFSLYFLYPDTHNASPVILALQNPVSAIIFKEFSQKFQFVRPSPLRRGPSCRRPKPRRPEGPCRSGDSHTNRKLLRNIFENYGRYWILMS